MFSKSKVLASAACLAIAAAIPVAVSAAQSEKVTVCHLSGKANDIMVTPAIPILNVPVNMWVFGRMIEVNENAVDAHVAHGDSATPHPVPAGPVLSGAFWTMQEMTQFPFGIGAYFQNAFEAGQFPNADCAIRYPQFS